MKSCCLLALGIALSASSDVRAQVIAGILRDSSGKPLSDGRVTVSGTTRSSYTGPAGQFVISPAPPGDVVLIGRRIGYLPDSARVHVLATDTTRIDLRLRVAAPMIMGTSVIVNTGGFPTIGTVLDLPGNAKGTVRSVAELEGPGLKSLAFYVESSTPASDWATIRRQARYLVDLHMDEIEAHGITRVTIGFCRRASCAELGETPSELFVFVRDANGRWIAEK